MDKKIKTLANTVLHFVEKEETKKIIERIVYVYEKGYITTFEAFSKICESANAECQEYWKAQ